MNAIEVKNLGKKFRLRPQGGRSLKSAALEWLRRGASGARDLWALKDVTFNVKPGEVLGIIGAGGIGRAARAHRGGPPRGARRRIPPS